MKKNMYMCLSALLCGHMLASNLFQKFRSFFIDLNCGMDMKLTVSKGGSATIRSQYFDINYASP
jgi:hypothetical protein